MSTVAVLFVVTIIIVPISGKIKRESSQNTE
ncbi:hypothetical protein PHG25p008nc [Aeromonas phage 25]|uniref:Uncharacterized protein n=1 Tax=Aeromonas phage 25 TaxID=2911441 RepID=Q19D12_9CAUD|nr:hypothetical protein PHG25p008nc [Aeromonas phage 25]ABF72567.1 hypothetical protein PHG25p008nc [Aeromonas phage 25]